MDPVQIEVLGVEMDFGQLQFARKVGKIDRHLARRAIGAGDDVAVAVGAVDRDRRAGITVRPAGGKRRDGGEKDQRTPHRARSEEHTSELQSLMRTSYAVFCLKKKKT